jgi:RNA polymerase sigma-70 factor (ECF subfamily)
VIPPDSPADRPPAADDLALVQRIADGDPLALSALYDRHAPAIYSHAFHLLGDAAEGEDAVEETFWRVWKRAAKYDPSVPDVTTWLLMICRQRATERLRVRKPSQNAILDDPTGLASAEPASGVRAAATAAAMAAIPAEQRTVLELAFFRGMTPVEIATVTKQSPETARTRLRVAMRKLRDALIEVATPAPKPDVTPKVAE